MKDYVRHIESVEKEKYDKYVKSVTPTTSMPKNVMNAFFVGGAICLLGQIINNVVMNFGVDKLTASGWTNVVLIG